MLQHRAMKCVALIGAIVLGVFAGAARAATYGDIEVTPQSIAHGQTDHGYAAYVFNVRNTSRTASHDVTITLPEKSAITSAGVYRLSRHAVVGPRQTVKVTLLQPPLGMYGSAASVAIDGAVQARGVGVGGSFEHMNNSSYGGTSSDFFTTLLSQPINRSDVENRFDAVLGGASSAGTWSPVQRQWVQADLPIAAWSDDWLGYSRFDSVVLTAEEFNSAPGPVRGALEHYLSAGGVLVLTGAFDPPAGADWRPALADWPGATEYASGFGKVIVLSSKNPALWSPIQVRGIRDASLAAGRPLRETHSVEDANHMFEVKAHLGVPVRGLFVVMLVFAILVGPVNLIVLSRRKRRIWILWTVPAISLFACGAVFAYNMLSEGFTAYERMQLYTVLDQRTHQASSIGWCAFYAPLTPGDGLHFSYDTELTPQIGQNMYAYGPYGPPGVGDSRARSIDWTSDQHLDSGWVISRVPAFFKMRDVHTERQRIDINQDADGQLTVTNGLRVAVRSLVYVSPDGRVLESGPIAPGAKAALANRSPGLTASVPHPKLRDVYTTDWLSKLRPDHVAEEIAPGDYVAVLDGPAFIDDPLPGAVMRPGVSILYGITEHDASK